MKYLDSTFWKFVVAFLATILVTLVTVSYLEEYKDRDNSGQIYMAK